MIRPTRRQASLALAIVAALCAAPAAALAAAPASDEYVLEIPGVRQTESGPVAGAATGDGDAGDGVQRGVVAEQDTPSTPLAALGDALAGFPAAFAVGLLALAAIVALAVSASRPTPHSPR
ncbi:MAG: hypothetical protein U0R51_13215 [Solirubrobacterales bacterium]